MPLLSLPLYGVLVLAGLVICCLPPRRVGRLTRGVGLSPWRLGLTLPQLASALLCNGSYLLCDIAVPEEAVRLRVRAI